MVCLVVEIDGLLQRFGRVVPDAVAMLAVVARLSEYLETRPSFPRLAVRLARFVDRPDGEAGLEELRRSVAKLEPWSLFGPLGAGARLVAPGELPGLAPAGEPAARVILLTASHVRLRRTVASGVDAYHVGLATPPEARGLPFDEVPRMVEEALRLPTARPMAPEARTGGLLAIAVAGPEDLTSRVLAALVEDPAADWVRVGSDLILYTEQPDLEDRLAAEAGVRHLSYAVRQSALVLERSADAAAEDVLYQGSGYRLREDVEAAGRSGAEAMPWRRVRRRGFDAVDRLGSRAPSVAPSAGEYLDALHRYRPLVAEGLDSGTGRAEERLLAVVREALGGAATADLPGHGELPAAVSWTTPYGGGREELVAVVHDVEVADESAVESALAAVAPGALALSEALGSVSSPAGILHCLRLTREVPIDALLDSTLRAEERNRLVAVVRLEDLAAVAGGEAGFEITADRRLERRLSGPPVDPTQVEWTAEAAGDPARLDARAHGAAPDGALERLLAVLASIVA